MSAPVAERWNQLTIPKLSPRHRFCHVGDIDPVQHGVRHKVRVVDKERAFDPDFAVLAGVFKDPRRN
jgi:hypothetical protein